MYAIGRCIRPCRIPVLGLNSLPYQSALIRTSVEQRLLAPPDIEARLTHRQIVVIGKAEFDQMGKVSLFGESAPLGELRLRNVCGEHSDPIVLRRKRAVPPTPQAVSSTHSPGCNAGASAMYRAWCNPHWRPPTNRCDDQSTPPEKI